MKTPNRFMQSVIVIVLLAYFGAAMFLPVFWPNVQIDPAFAQTLVTLVVAAVMYYIGTSSGSEKKNDTIASLTAPPVPPPPTTTNQGPTP